MSIVFQYIVLRKILIMTHSTMQTPSAFALAYSELHVIPILWKFQATKKKIHKMQWNTCCILFNMGLVEMRNNSEWLIAVSKDGALYAAELKLQIIKSVCTVLLAIFSALLGFWFGQL